MTREAGEIRRIRVWQIFVILALVLAIGLRLANLSNVISRTPDEKVYTQQANVWLQSGEAGIGALVAQFERDPAARLYPSPTRIGMIRLDAAAMEITGRRDETAGAIVSCAASIGSIVILALIGLRFFPPLAVVVGLLLAAVSPMELTIARRAWADAVVELAGVSMAYIGAEIALGARRAWYPLFAVIAGIGITVKEFSAFTAGLCALWVVAALGFARKEWKNALLFVAATAIAAAASLLWLGSYVGGLAQYFHITLGIARDLQTNSYELAYGSGPAYLLGYGFWIISPVAAVLSLVGIAAAFSPLRARSGISLPVLWIGIFVLVHVLVAMAMPHWLNLRYISAVFGPFCLLAGLGLERIVLWSRSMAPQPLRAAVAFLIICAAAAGGWSDYRRFERIFVKRGTPDLAIGFLLQQRQR